MAFNNAPNFNVPTVYRGGEDGWGQDPNMGFGVIQPNENGVGGGYKPIYVNDLSSGSVGYWSPEIRHPDENGMGGGINPVWHGSQQDFTGLTGGDVATDFYGRTSAVYEDKNGLKFNYDPNSDSFQGIDPQTAQNLLQTNPDAYYGTLGNQLKDEIFQNWSMSHDGANADLYKKLESIKNVSPKSYYESKLGLLGSKVGWNAGQNTMDRTADLQTEIKNLAPQAIQAGLAPEQFTNIVDSSFSNANRSNQQLIANRAQSGGAFIKPNDWVTIASILGGGALAAYMAPVAAAGELAGAGAVAGEGALTTSEILGSNFAGSGFAIDPLATYAPGIAGLGDSALTTTEILNSTGFTPTEGSSFTIDPSASYTTGAGSISDATKLPESQVGPTSPSMSASDALKTANQVRQGLGTANALAKLVSPSTGAATGTTSGINGANLSQLANLLRPQAQTNDFIGQYKMNQNPFTFTTQGQTAASPGMYDVSGSNLANALRKA